MFKKILVPVDFTEKNEAALSSAIEIAGRSDGEEGEVSLLHVIETIEHIEFDEMSDFYRGLETRASARLFAMEERLRQAGIRARHDIVYGKRAETIVRYAEDHGIDLMILSSHKVDRDHPALGWGTISYRIAIVARCPVLLVK
ncbi:MAG TPA: universal stress protein [Thermoanaerobaculia bacterium]|jgi:nucleotide-binding universal stress UspA family protein|nr:universal stress protein [Thermoanaerobaculia bacterium]